MGSSLNPQELIRSKNVSSKKQNSNNDQLLQAGTLSSVTQDISNENSRCGNTVQQENVEVSSKHLLCYTIDHFSIFLMYVIFSLKFTISKELLYHN